MISGRGGSMMRGGRIRPPRRVSYISPFPKACTSCNTGALLIEAILRASLKLLMIWTRSRAVSRSTTPFRRSVLSLESLATHFLLNTPHITLTSTPRLALAVYFDISEFRYLYFANDPTI